MQKHCHVKLINKDTARSQWWYGEYKGHVRDCIYSIVISISFVDGVVSIELCKRTTTRTLTTITLIKRTHKCTVHLY